MNEWKEVFKGENIVEYECAKDDTVFTARFIVPLKEVSLNSLYIPDKTKLYQAKDNIFISLTLKDLEFITTKAKELFKEGD